MRKSRFTEHQIVRILKSVEGGRTVKDVCREYGVSSATCYKWKSKYGGMGDFTAHRLLSVISQCASGFIDNFRQGAGGIDKPC